MRELLPLLLFHANRNSKAKEFYEIKNYLLNKYGELVGHDIQYLPGARCFNCDGTGKYQGITNCWRCQNGWYKLPRYVLLKRYQFGKYEFHQPIQSALSQEELPAHTLLNVIEGYITHERSRYGDAALQVLYALYNKKQTKDDLPF